MERPKDDLDGAIQPSPEPVLQLGVHVEDEANPQSEQHEEERGTSPCCRGHCRGTRYLEVEDAFRRPGGNSSGTDRCGENPCIEEIDKTYQEREAPVVERQPQVLQCEEAAAPPGGIELLRFEIIFWLLVCDEICTAEVGCEQLSPRHRRIHLEAFFQVVGRVGECASTARYDEIQGR